jgi:hypothetical protein
LGFPDTRAVGLAGRLGSRNSLTTRVPIFGLRGIGACPFLIIRSAPERRHNLVEARCRIPVKGSRMAASRSPPSSKMRSRSQVSSYRLFALYSAWYAALEGSPDEDILTVTGRAPGAPLPRAGVKSLILNHSSSLINPLGALYSSPVHSDEKSSRPRWFSASRTDL